jgi:hypothetical protein
MRAFGVAISLVLALSACQEKKDSESKKPAAENSAKKEAATFQAETAGPEPNPERNA